MDSVYVICFIISLISFVVFGFTIYRYYTMTVTGIIDKIDCTSQPSCQLNITYYYNNIKLNGTIYTQKSDWNTNQSIPIYINPTDLNSPKYAPPLLTGILYLLLILSISIVILSIYKMVN